MKKNRDFKDGNIIELKEPYEYDKGCFTKVFEYATWDLDGAAFRPYHKGTCGHFRLIDSNGKEWTHKQIMAKADHLWETEQEFFQNGGPQLGMYELGNDLYQVIQKADGKISSLRQGEDSTRISWEEFFLHYWIDVVAPQAIPAPKRKLITRVIENNTPELPPFNVQCIDSSGVTDILTEGRVYTVTKVRLLKSGKRYTLIGDTEFEVSAYADRFVWFSVPQVRAVTA